MATHRMLIQQIATTSYERPFKTLPIRFREPIVLRYFQQLPVTEIADVLGLSPGAVEVRLSRARQRLKDKLGRHFGRE